MIEVSLYEHLKANVTSVNERVFANVMHQNTEKPAMVYTVTEERPNVSLSTECLGADMEWVLHIYAEKYTENKTVKNEVVAALKTFEPRAKDIRVSDGFDEQSELYIQVIQFKTNQRS